MLTKVLYIQSHNVRQLLAHANSASWQPDTCKQSWQSCARGVEWTPRYLTSHIGARRRLMRPQPSNPTLKLDSKTGLLPALVAAHLQPQGWHCICQQPCFQALMRGTLCERCLLWPGWASPGCRADHEALGKQVSNSTPTSLRVAVVKALLPHYL